MELVDDPYLFTDSADGSVPSKADTISQYDGRMRARVELEHIDLNDLRTFMETYSQEMGHIVTPVATRAGHDPSIAAKHDSGRVTETDRALANPVTSFIAPPRSLDGRSTRCTPSTYEACRRSPTTPRS